MKNTDLDNKMRLQHLIDEFVVAEIKKESNLGDWPIVNHQDGTISIRTSDGTYYSLNMHMTSEFIEFVRKNKLGYKEFIDK